MPCAVVAALFIIAIAGGFSTPANAVATLGIRTTFLIG